MDLNTIAHISTLIIELVLFLLIRRLKNQVFDWFDQQQTIIEVCDSKLKENIKLSQEINKRIDDISKGSID